MITEQQLASTLEEVNKLIPNTYYMIGSLLSENKTEEAIKACANLTAQLQYRAIANSMLKDDYSHYETQKI